MNNYATKLAVAVLAVFMTVSVVTSASAARRAPRPVATVTVSSCATPTPTVTPTVTPTATVTPTVTTAPTQTSSPSVSATATPTTTPTATSTAGQKNCALDPSACGYPDADNTGAKGTLRKVPSQVSSGDGWYFDTRGWVTVDGDGAVLENLDIPYTIDVKADNVTIRNVKVSVDGEGFGIALRSVANATITKSTITASDAGANRLMVGIKDIYGDSTNTLVSYNDISRTSTGVQMDQGTIEWNYIHDLGFIPGDHVNGTTSNSAGGNWLFIRNNTIFNKYDQTDAISLFQDFGPQYRRVISGNLVAGGGYTIYGGANAGKPAPTEIQITNNRISRLYFPNGGQFGPFAAVVTTGTGNVVSGNFWDDTLAPVG